MKKHTFRTVLLTCLALVMVLGASVGESLSYFTTYVTARGGHPIRLEAVDVRVRERMDGNVKQISIENVGEAECFVRVLVLHDSLAEVTFSGEGWTLGDDGYWYYSQPLAPGEVSSVLSAAVTAVEGADQDYQVVVYAEATPVLHDEAGNAYADWNMKARVE